VGRQQKGKRVGAGTKFLAVLGKRKLLILVVAIVVILFVLYLCICGYVYAGTKILPRTSAGGVSLGGLTQAQAVQTLEEDAGTLYAQQEVTFLVRLDQEESRTVTVSGSEITMDPLSTAEKAARLGRENGVLGAGASWLKAVLVGHKLDTALTFSTDSGIDAQLTALTTEVEQSVVETTYALAENNLMIQKGTSGMGFDVAAIKEQILDSFLNQVDTQPAFVVDPVVSEPEEFSLEALYQEVYVAAQDAHLDTTTKEIVPAVTGVSFDIAGARAQLDATEEGDICVIALVLEAPSITTQQLTSNLFKDTLAQTQTKCSGTSARLYNIALACSYVDGTILLPGEVFSYTDLCGPYSEANGYQKAGAYVNGKTVDTTAGGICQLSSTLYWATLVANLETVERTHHTYDPGYLPVVGTDATVYGTSPDFRFKNDTAYPIKISCYKDSSQYVHVTIYGTDTTGIHGEPYSKVVSTTAAGTVYEADASVPVGTTKVDSERTAYTGKKVEVYLNLVDKSGNVVETKYLHTDTYAKRDRVILYNPADSASYNGSAASQTPASESPTVSPSPSADVSPSPSADVSPSPVTSETPTATPSPSTEPSPSTAAPESTTPSDTSTPAESQSVGEGMVAVQ